MLIRRLLPLFCLLSGLLLLPACQSSSRGDPKGELDRPNFSTRQIRQRKQYTMLGVGTVHADQMQQSDDVLARRAASGRVFFESGSADPSAPQFAYAERAAIDPVAQRITLLGTPVVEFGDFVVYAQTPDTVIQLFPGGNYLTKGPVHLTRVASMKSRNTARPGAPLMVRATNPPIPVPVPPTKPGNKPAPPLDPAAAARLVPGTPVGAAEPEAPGEPHHPAWAPREAVKSSSPPAPEPHHPAWAPRPSAGPAVDALDLPKE